MKHIWKYQLDITDRQSHQMPAGTQILTAQMQGDSLTLWALVDPAQPTTERKIWIIGTGHSISEDALHYIGTVQQANGQLVWHIFAEAK